MNTNMPIGSGQNDRFKKIHNFTATLVLKVQYMGTLSVESSHHRRTYEQGL